MAGQSKTALAIDVELMETRCSVVLGPKNMFLSQVENKQHPRNKWWERQAPQFVSILFMSSCLWQEPRESNVDLFDLFRKVGMALKHGETA